jgi:choline dehydrogenase-like flavoprotein
MAEPARERTEVLVIGSGAGGAVTAFELAAAGRDVAVLEEGGEHADDEYGKSSPEAMRLLYRRRGMTPILGKVPLGYVEGACVGGSTEINSGFWHRTPREVLSRWHAQFDLAHVGVGEMTPHFEWAEARLGISKYEGEWPKSTQVFARGIDAMGWASQEVPRAAPGCRSTNACASGCPTGAKRGMSRAIWPEARERGARLVTRCRVHQLLFERHRCIGVLAEVEVDEGRRVLARIDADHVIVCAGPTETPALLRRSGVKFHVGETLRVHPMLKVAARFPETIDAQDSVLPLLQVKEFWPDVSLGGAFFTPGHLALGLSDNWPETSDRMARYRNMASYYVAVRGAGRGWVRPSKLGDGATLLHYDVGPEDLKNLSRGLGRLASLLLAAGAEEVLPAVRGMPVIRNEREAVRWLDEPLPKANLSLTTVHAFSSCPIGERSDRCAADSFGKLRRYENLYVNDASVLPDSPGVNPQGSVMAFARRNALHFLNQIS